MGSNPKGGSSQDNDKEKLMTSRSRLIRKERIRSLRRTFLYGSLTVLILILLSWGGIPVLVRVATFFSEWQSSKTPVDKTDLFPPPPPQIDLLPRATNQKNLSLSGQAEPGSIVEVFLNEASYQTVVAGSRGSFIVEQVKLFWGENEIYAIATDQAGNISQPSKKIKILFDDQPPELELFSPGNEAIFRGESEKKVTVSGKTEPNVSLAVNDRLVILNQDGSFSTKLTLSEGENTIKVVATDLAENQTEKEIKVFFTP